MQTVGFETSDNLKIVADWYPSGTRQAALLVHMVPADRASWRQFAQALVKAGIGALALDLRGHGQSSRGPLGYQKFSTLQHGQSRLDLEAAANWLKSKGQTLGLVAGASLGANLALNFACVHSTPAVILLSPGLDYHGVTTKQAAGCLTPKQKTFIIASTDDQNAPGANLMAQQIFDLMSCQKQIHLETTTTHGTDILEHNPKLTQTLIDFIKN